MLLPFLAAFIPVLAKIAPQLATKLLAPCDLQHASYVLLRVRYPQLHCHDVQVHDPVFDGDEQPFLDIQ